ncbi:MAG: hypothetical protein ACRDUY_14900 [Nitriliruptorales bacterium]
MTDDAALDLAVVGRDQPRSRGLDRVARPDPLRPRRDDLTGKRALYSVDFEAYPTPLVHMSCHRCGSERGLSGREVKRVLVRLPWVADPIRRRLWARCPTCRHRSWLDVRLAPGIPWPF